MWGGGVHGGQEMTGDPSLRSGELMCGSWSFQNSTGCISFCQASEMGTRISAAVWKSHSVTGATIHCDILSGTTKLPPGGTKSQWRVGFSCVPVPAPTPCPCSQLDRGKFSVPITKNTEIWSWTDLASILLLPKLLSSLR